MTFVIASACIDVLDQSCIEVCPVDCIYAERVKIGCVISNRMNASTAVCANLLVLLVLFSMSRRCRVKHCNLLKLIPYGSKTKKVLVKE